MAQQPHLLLCTVGTSLKGNLKRWRTQEMKDDKDIEDYTAHDWEAAVQYISDLDPHNRQCGAEVNSIQALIDEGLVIPKPEIHLFHSDTDDGRNIARLLDQIYARRGFYGRVRCHAIEGLKDSDPKAFRTKGLRNLVRQLCGHIHVNGAEACAINATGGYKAQIAIAVMIGQALGVPVYYKHEFFAHHSIISFPPLPIALDEKIWHDNMSFFHELYEADDFVSAAPFKGELDEILESLIERERQDDEEYLFLSPAGYILHEKCRNRASESETVLLLRDAKHKDPPQLSGEHLSPKQPEIRAYMQRVINDNPFVTTCRLFYANPDLSQHNRFKISRGEVVGVYSDGSFTAKFFVKTTADGENLKPLAVERLNQWLAGASP